MEAKLRDTALAGVAARLTYLPDSEQVVVHVLPKLGKENRAAQRVITSEVQVWPGNGHDVEAMRSHLSGVFRRYLGRVRERSWPETENYTTRCFSEGADVTAGRATRCAECTAWYCSVTR